MKRYLQSLSGTLNSADFLKLTTLRNTAHTHTIEGRFSDAHIIYGQLLNLSERVLGGKHAFTLSIVDALGESYFRRGNTQKALRLYERALASFEVTLGRSHRETLTTVVAIGIIHVEQGELNTALPLLLRVVAGVEDLEGMDHPNTLLIMAIVAAVYSVVIGGNVRTFVETAVERMKGVFGEDHPLTRETMTNLAVVLLRQGRYEQATAMFKRVDGESPKETNEELVLDTKYKINWRRVNFCLLGILLGVYYFSRSSILAGVLLG